MTLLNISEAQEQLSDLVARAVAGEEVLIGNGTAPLVRLAPIRQRRFGALKGVVSLDESFFDPLPNEQLDAWGSGR